MDTDSSLVDMRAEKRLTDYIRQIYAKLESGTELERLPAQDELQHVFDEVPGFGGDEFGIT